MTDRERWRRELSSASPPAIATDALADLVFSLGADLCLPIADTGRIAFCRTESIGALKLVFAAQLAGLTASTTEGLGNDSSVSPLDQL